MADLKCSTCNQVKPTSDFPVANGKSRGFAWCCKKCKKDNRIKSAEKMGVDEWFLRNRSYWLRSAYGISLQQYNELLVKQFHRCAICFCDESEAYRGLLYVDHCHSTGNVRGLLCHHCNTGVGKMRESVEILKSAINYLELHNG